MNVEQYTTSQLSYHDLVTRILTLLASGCCKKGLVGLNLGSCGTQYRKSTFAAQKRHFL